MGSESMIRINWFINQNHWSLILFESVWKWFDSILIRITFFEIDFDLIRIILATNQNPFFPELIPIPATIMVFRRTPTERTAPKGCKRRSDQVHVCFRRLSSQTAGDEKRAGCRGRPLWSCFLRTRNIGIGAGRLGVTALPIWGARRILSGLCFVAF